MVIRRLNQKRVKPQSFLNIAMNIPDNIVTQTMTENPQLIDINYDTI